MIKKAIVLHINDNVASALVDLASADRVEVDIPGGGSLEITLAHAISLGHKFALSDIAKGEDVVKTGMSIGEATQSIRQGEHVHTHNVSNAHDDTIVEHIIN